MAAQHLTRDLQYIVRPSSYYIKKRNGKLVMQVEMGHFQNLPQKINDTFIVFFQAFL